LPAGIRTSMVICRICLAGDFKSFSVKIIRRKHLVLFKMAF
jgi:hypothetical protein